jgi:hypothetical protein
VHVLCSTCMYMRAADRRQTGIPSIHASIAPATNSRVPSHPIWVVSRLERSFLIYLSKPTPRLFLLPCRFTLLCFVKSPSRSIAHARTHARAIIAEAPPPASLPAPICRCLRCPYLARPQPSPLSSGRPSSSSSPSPPAASSTSPSPSPALLPAPRTHNRPGNPPPPLAGY